MQAADNVELGDSFAVSGSGGFKSLIERHSVGAGGVFLATESTQAAGCDADVGGIDVAIYVEISFVPMHALAHMIRHPPDGENIPGAIEGESIVRVQALTR